MKRNKPRREREPCREWTRRGEDEHALLSCDFFVCFLKTSVVVMSHIFNNAAWV